MASIIKVDDVQDAAGNNIINEAGDVITIGASGDTITIPSGATITNSGTATGFGGGKLGQVVVTTKTDTASVASASYADMSGMTVTITPVATSSKILLTGTAILQNYTIYGYFQFVRDIGGGGYSVPTGFVGDAAGSRVQSTSANIRTVTDDNISRTNSWHLIDSPSTTSACTYKMQCRNSSGTSSIYLGRSPYDGDAVSNNRSPSTLIAIEILA